MSDNEEALVDEANSTESIDAHYVINWDDMAQPSAKQVPMAAPQRPWRSGTPCRNICELSAG